MLLPSEFGELIAELNAESLEYVLVGGVAVNLLGYERATSDVDVVVPATRQQGQAIRRLLKRLGATRPDGSPLPDRDREDIERLEAAYGTLPEPPSAPSRG